MAALPRTAKDDLLLAHIAPDLLLMRVYDIERLRLHSPSEGFWVDLRVTCFDRTWLASCDTPDGPTLAWDDCRLGALLAALEPFDSIIPELLENQYRA